MITYKTSTYLDRLFPERASNKNVFLKTSQTVMPILKKYYDKPLFERTFMIKDIKEKLSILHINLDTYKTWKGFGATIGTIVGFILACMGPSQFFLPLLLLIPALAFAGFIVPEVYILDRQSYRNYKINTEFPQLLDLLKLYSESAAFETFGSALYQISLSMHGVLGRELRDLTSLYRFMSLEDFLKVMEKRFKDPLAQDLIATVRLSETYGGSVAQKISILAEEAHSQRMQKAKELGQKSSVALMIPLLLFHFPVALVVFLLPVVMNVIKLLGNQ
jgi:tight adherence protein C